MIGRQASSNKASGNKASSNKTSNPAFTDKEAAAFKKKMIGLRDGLPKNQRLALNKLLGGAFATDKFMKHQNPGSKDAKAFSQALTTFEKGLPPQQREGFTAMLLAGALAGGLTADSTPEDNSGSIYFIWVHLLRTAAVLITGAILVAREASKDEEIVVPVLDLPD